MQYELENVSIRMVKEPPLLSDKPISSPGRAVKVLYDLLHDMDREYLITVNLKADMTPINMNIASIGTINASLGSPRELLKTAILSGVTNFRPKVHQTSDRKPIKPPTENLSNLRFERTHFPGCTFIAMSIWSKALEHLLEMYPEVKTIHLHPVRDVTSGSSRRDGCFRLSIGGGEIVRC